MKKWLSRKLARIAAKFVRTVLESEMFKHAVRREIQKQLPVEMKRQRLESRVVINGLQTEAARKEIDRLVAESLEDSLR